MRNNLLLNLAYFMVFLLFSGCYYIMAEQPYIDRLERKAEKYMVEHPELDEQKKNLIRKGKINIGFSKEEVRLFYNYMHPDKMKTTSDYGAEEVWIYNEWSADEFLYFKGDRLIKIEIIPKK